MLKLDALIFDIDGVLIDVSESYRSAIRQTVQIYFEQIIGLAPCKGKVVSRKDVAAFKLAGGFNNDWELTTGIIQYFGAMLDAPEESRERPAILPEIIAFLHHTGAKIKTTAIDLQRKKDIPAFAAMLRAEGGGLRAVRKILGDRNDHLLFAQGDPREANVVMRIFEEVYLGEELFYTEYGEPPLIHHGEGLIRRERLIPNLQLLPLLSMTIPLGIATGRPRNQATYALEHAGIGTFFRALITHEDIVDAEQHQFATTGARVHLGKPHPFSLLQAAHRILPANARCAYIGDTLDDVRAANAAKSDMDFVSIACLAPAEDKETMRYEFEQVGADVIVDHPDELKDLIVL